MGKTNNTKPSTPVATSKASKPKKQTQQSKLQKLVNSNPHFQFIENGKVRCTVTKHEFLPTLENYQKYLQSKSYKKGIEAQFDLKDYEDYLVTHKENPHFLFCRLTGVKLPKRKTAIEKHVQSKRFKSRLEQALNQNGKQEEEDDELQFEDEEEEVVNEDQQ